MAATMSIEILMIFSDLNDDWWISGGSTIKWRVYESGVSSEATRTETVCARARAYEQVAVESPAVSWATDV
jgi:hypothetical protein